MKDAGKLEVNMRFVRMRAAAAAMLCSTLAGYSGQSLAFTTVASGMITTDASGMVIIPLTPLNHLGHLWRNKFSWSSDIPVALAVQQEYDMTIGTRSYWSRSTKPPAYIPGTTTTTHVSFVEPYGTSSRLTESFEGAWSGVSQYTTYQDANYMAALIAKTAPNTAVNFTLKIGSAPEPSTWALMILGFGAIGAAMRRKVRTLYPL